MNSDKTGRIGPDVPLRRLDRHRSAVGNALRGVPGSGKAAPTAPTERHGRRSLQRALALAGCLLCLLAPVFAAEVTQGPPRIRNVYIPSDELKLLFDGPTKGVLMPRDKVLALWEEARRRAPSPAVPPADAVLAHASYEAQLADHELRMNGRIQIAALREGLQTVDLPFGGLAIESAQLGPQPARFGRKDDGTLFLVLEKEGRFELQLEMSAPLASKGGDLAAALKFPPVPASELSIWLDKGRQLQVGETTLESEGADEGRQQFRIAVGRTGLVSLVISERSAGGNRAPLVLVNSRSIGRIEPAGLRWEVALDLDVYARAADSIRLQLPGTVDLAEVDSPELARWSSQDQPDGVSMVTLAFRKPVLGRRTVRLLGLAPVPPATSWAFPAVKVLDAAAHVGQVALYPSSSQRVEVGNLAGVGWDFVPANTGSGQSPNPPAAPAGAQLTFAFWDENFKLPLRVTDRRRTVQASVATLVEVDRSGAAMRGSATLQPRHAPVFDIQLQLARDWEITSVLSANKPVGWDSVPTDAEPGQSPNLQTIRFEPAQPLGPGQLLEIALTARRRPDRWLEQDEKYQELPLPDLRLVGADEVEGTLLVRSPADIELLASDLSDNLQPVAASSVGWDSVPTKSGSGQSPNLQIASGQSPNLQIASGQSPNLPGTALQYRYRGDGRASGRLQVRMKPARVAVETLAFVRLDRGRLDVHYQADLRIRQGTLRQVRFALPASVGEKIQIVPVESAARIIEQRHSPLVNPADKAELYLWRIVLDRPVSGDLTLAVDFGETFSAEQAGWDSVPTETGSGQSPNLPDQAGTRVAVPVLAFQDVSRQGGMVAVEAADDQQIGCESENLRDLDPADVRKPKAYTPSHRIVAAYQYQRLPYRLAISATRHAAGSVLTGVCESAEIISVADREGRMRHQARFRLRSLSLPHVPVVLPEGADLWSAMLDGSPVEVRRKQGAFTFPLPAGQAGSADAGRELTLVYETRVPRWEVAGWRALLWPQAVRQSAPEIAMTTLGTTWHLHPPDGTDLVSSGGDFQPESPLTRPALATRLAETIARESVSALFWKLVGLLVAVVLAGFFALAWTSKGCSASLVEILVVIAIIGILISLLLPATQSAREAARRSQCTNNLKQIGLALHNYHDVHKQFPPAAIGPSNVPRDRQFSWLVAILPFVEQQNLYQRLRLDLPCDHPHNAALLQVPFSTLLCPSDPSRTTTQEGLCKTSYVAITGADSTRGSGSTRGVIGLDRGLRIDEIVDGTSNTLIVAEVVDGGPWFAGGSGTARRIDDWIEKKSWSHHPGGANVLFADGAVQFLASTVEAQTLRDIATAQGLEQMDARAAVSGEVSRGEERVTPPPTAQSPMPASKEEEAKPLVLSTAPQPKPSPPTPPRPADQPPAKQAEPMPAEKPSPAVSVQPRMAAGGRARLSLAVALETHGGQAVRFRREGGPGELLFAVQDRTFANALQWFVVGAALLAAWIARRVPGRRRAMAVVVGLALPIALSGLVPLAWTPLLEGLLWGAVAAGCLWGVREVFAAFRASMSPPAAATIVIGLGLLFATHASAAEEPAGRLGPRPDQAGAQVGTESQPTKADLTLFIPYDPGSGKPLEKSQVYIRHDDFQRLWKQAHPDEANRPAPDVRAVVSHAEYSGRLEGDVARFDGRLAICQFVAGWGRVALPMGKVAVEKIEIDGRPATLAGDDRDQPAIYLEKTGVHVVDVRFGVPVSRLGATGQMTVPLRPVPTGRLMFELPQKDLEVRVHGNAGGWRRQAAPPRGPHDPREEVRPAERDGHRESISVPLGAVNDLSIHWQPRRVEAREGQLMSADHALLIEVLDSGIHFHSRFHYRIQQGAVRELRLRIPPGVAVQGVQGNEVADWSIETDPAKGDQPAQQRLVVALKTEKTGGTDVDVMSFCRRLRLRPDPVGTQVGTESQPTIDALQPLGVVRETGRVAIGCVRRLRVRVGKTDGLDQIDRAGIELPHAMGEGCALLSAYRYTSRPWLLQVEVERDHSRVEVSDRTAVAVTVRQAVLRSLLTAHVTGAPVRSFGLRLPDSLMVSQVRVPPGADWFIDRSDQGQRLRVELNGPAIGNLDLGVSGVIARDPRQAEFAVSGVTVDEAAAQRGQSAVYLDDDLQAVLVSDGGSRSIEPSAVDAALRSAANRPAQYAFQYESPPKDLRLRLSSAPSRASGDVTTVVSVRDGAVAYVSQVDFEIQQARRGRFQVVTPQWLGEDIQVHGEQIRQVRSNAADGQRTWDVELQRPVRGVYRLYLLQTLPLPDDGTVRAAVIRPLGVERSRGYVVLENATNDEIAATTVDGVTAVPVTAVPEGLADAVRRHAVAAYRVVGDPATLAWQRRTREQETALTATVNMADLTTVVHADGHYRARAIYNIRNFTLQFLELELPPKSQVWSASVSGQPVRPATVHREGRPITLLPLQKTSAADLSSKVVVIYSGALGEPLGRWTLVRPPAPQIVSKVPVSRTLWTVFLPRQYKVSLVKGQSNLEEVAAAYQQEERKLSFLDELQQILQVAGSKGMSGARAKAQYNLKQFGVALDDYATQAGQAGAKNAAEVQSQAQHIAAEVKRLETLKTEGKRADDETYYFKPRPEPTDAERDAAVDRDFERLPEPDAKKETKPAPKDGEKKIEGRPAGAREEPRGDLRKQAAEQLARLQTMEPEELFRSKTPAPQQPSKPPEAGRDSAAAGVPRAGEQAAGGQAPLPAQAAVATPAAEAGRLSMDLDIALVGSPHHFSKLHGDPRIVLRARHESLSRVLTAMLWAGVCLAMAAAVVQGLRRPDALQRAYRGWPWLAAVAGVAWLFLLPAGVFGLGLFMVALCVLIARLRRSASAR